MLPDFNKETGNFNWNKFEKPLKKKKKNPEDDLMAQVLENVEKDLSSFGTAKLPEPPKKEEKTSENWWGPEISIGV